VARRALPFRLLARAGLILRAGVTRWGIVEERSVKPLAAARTGPTTIDLAAPPAQRVWMNPGRRPFDLGVRLPGGGLFHAWPAFAVMLGDRLTVQLGEADLGGTAAALQSYGVSRTEIADWRRGAAQRPAAPPAHSPAAVRRAAR